ncbi:hypothetical protein, partial [Clostridium perfringens]
PVVRDLALVVVFGLCLDPTVIERSVVRAAAIERGTWFALIVLIATVLLVTTRDVPVLRTAPDRPEASTPYAAIEVVA